VRDPEAQLLQKYHARNRSSGPGVGSLNEIATFAFSQSKRVSKWVVGALTGPYPLPHAPIIRSRWLTSGGGPGGEPMGQAQPKRRTALIVEDDAELRSLTAALLEEEQLDTIECESAEAALAVLLIGGQDIAMIFADVRLPGAMDGIDLAWEVKLRWPLLPVVLTSGHPRERERVRELPPGIAFLPKPWQPFNVLVVAEEALAYAQGNRS
jgi:CheY-like chemotaxis protein